jgi:hypothetical protein
MNRVGISELTGLCEGLKRNGGSHMGALNPRQQFSPLALELIDCVYDVACAYTSPLSLRVGDAANG